MAPDRVTEQAGLWVRYDANQQIVGINAVKEAAGLTCTDPGDYVEFVPEDTRRAHFWRLGPFSGGWSPSKNGLGAASGWTLWLLRWRGLSVEIGWHPDRRAVSS